MDLLSYGLVCGTIVVMGESIVFIKNNIFSIRRTWNKIGLRSYKIKEIKKITNGYVLKIKVKIGGSISDIQKYIDKLEKAYACKCYIEDISYSNYVLVKLMKNEDKN